ncbi:MAG: calcium-binding protein, partial [Pseudomonadota bacterium]
LEGGRTAITTEALVAYNGLRSFFGLAPVELETIGQWAFDNDLTNNAAAYDQDLFGVGLYYGMQGAKVGWIRDEAFDPQILADIQRTARLGSVEDVMAMVEAHGHPGFAAFLRSADLVDEFVNTLKMEPHYGGWMHGRVHGGLAIPDEAGGAAATAHDLNHLTVLSHDQTQPFMNDTFDWPQWPALDVAPADVIDYFQSMVVLGDPLGDALPAGAVGVTDPELDPDPDPEEDAGPEPDDPESDDEEEASPPVYGSEADDSLSGGSGRDAVSGLGGDDWISGLAGRDTLLGGDGDDVIRGGAGNDNLRGGDGEDLVRGQNGADRMFGNTGDDELFGANGDDTLKGNADNDNLVGGGGDDRLYGGRGDDTLNGSAGDDRLVGGAGDDVMTGGAGVDRFILRQNAGDDVITDFEDGVEQMRIQNGAERFEDLSVVQAGETALISFAGSTISLQNFDAAEVTADDFLF